MSLAERLAEAFGAPVALAEAALAGDVEQGRRFGFAPGGDLPRQAEIVLGTFQRVEEGQ